MRMTIGMTVAAVVAGLLLATPSAVAEPPPAACNYPHCTPGIAPNVVLGAPCQNTTYFAFGVTSWGRLVFCGSPRRYAPRWFRSPEMHGIKYENSDCAAYEGEVAQAPDGLFLTCVAEGGAALWRRGDT